MKYQKRRKNCLARSIFSLLQKHKRCKNVFRLIADPEYLLTLTPASAANKGRNFNSSLSRAVNSFYLVFEG